MTPMHKYARGLLLITLPLLSMASNADQVRPCENYTPQRQAFFGDTHVHTAYSLDAYGRFGARGTPNDAYAFARGEPIDLPPFDQQGHSQRSLQLDRPLDFTAVTDHAENLDFVRICSDPENPGNNSWTCGQLNLGIVLGQSLLQGIANKTGLEQLHHCGADGSRCPLAQGDVWRDTINAASRHNTPCSFTTFAAYEWSGNQGGNMLHRNVLFGGDWTTALPVSSLQAPQAEQLWQALDDQCPQEGGCPVITIPHNSNMSGGKMFSATLTNGEPLNEQVAEQRNRYERLAEIYQHKGSSECFFDPLQSEDELCSFEYLPYSSTIDKYIRAYLPGLVEAPSNDNRFIREALREGFRARRTLGINPYMTGLIASTDTHIAAPGAVQESNYAGHHGKQDLSADGARVDKLEQGPGGLAVVYAEQNTRKSLFAGMQRREAYGTSGTRIGLRFFGGAELAQDLCERSDMIEAAYRDGVPMGDVLKAMPQQAAPRFLVAATRDPLQGAPLQRLQIIKGWVDAEGVSRERVIDVSGQAGSTAGVDLATCEPAAAGAAKLCALWTDPEFNPDLDAYYYARAVENPSCRWTTYACLAQQVDCAAGSELPESLAHCCDASVPKTIQERAWSSPIWYQPD